MSDEIELKRCPFCGQPVTLEGNRFVCGGCGNPNWFFDPEHEAAAITEWNSRPIEAAQAAEIERLIASQTTQRNHLDAMVKESRIKDVEIAHLRTTLAKINKATVRMDDAGDEELIDLIKLVRNESETK